MPYYKRAFSLVELSIVLVILGLLTGGILTGQSLIRASELRSVSTQFQSFQTAMYSFKVKYLALPGDMTNATDFWGSIGGNSSDNFTSTCYGIGGTNGSTCNGNGSGRVSDGSPATREERWLFWQHLANANLLNGTYTGTPASGGAQHCVPGENVPPGKISGTGWALSWADGGAGSSNDFALDQSVHSFQIGSANSTTTPNEPAFTPEETWGIDTKFDDGVPGTGNVTIKYWDACTEAADQNDVTASYALDVTSVECVIKFFIPD